MARALDSLLIQTFKDFEVIVVDDNAKEEWNQKVSAVVQAFQDQTNIPIRLIINAPNLGSAKARNRGIEVASGEYITFLDDDIYLPEKIEHQYKQMKQKEADYSLTDLGLYNADGTISEIRKREYFQSEEATNLLLCHLKYHMTGTDTMMFKTEYIKQMGGFEPIDVGDEFYLMLKAINAGGKFVYVPVNDVKAYVHTGEGGLSSGQGKIDGENALYEYKKKYFSDLKNKDIRYIKMRHHAVLAFANKRCANTAQFMVEGFKAVFIAPLQCLKLLRELK